MSAISDIGTALVAKRRSLGIPQRELAARIGSTQQQVARWEASCYRSASLSRVVAVAHALDCPIGQQSPQPIAAEARSVYGVSAAVPVAESTAAPVRDLGEIAARLRAHGQDLAIRGIRRIGVFGSFAMGEQTAESDVDLLVEFSNRPQGLAYLDGPEFTEKLLGRSVDWVELELVLPRLHDRILSEVVYVWEA